MTHHAHGRRTEYKGYLFRSSLEARWAVFFDLLGIEWRYEPIDLNGYIPDFILPERNLLVEVKPIFNQAEASQHAAKVIDSGWMEHFVIVGAHWFIGECDVFGLDRTPVLGAYFEPCRFKDYGTPCEPYWDFDVHDDHTSQLVWCTDWEKGGLGWNEPHLEWYNRMRRSGFVGKRWGWLEPADIAELDQKWAAAHRRVQWKPGGAR